MTNNNYTVFPGNNGNDCPADGEHCDESGRQIILCDECEYQLCCCEETDCDNCSISSCPRKKQILFSPSKKHRKP